MNKKHIVLILKFLVSLGLMWILVSSFDLEAAGGRILTADPKLLGLATFIFFVQLLICVVRWRVVLAAIGGVLSFLDSFHFFFFQICTYGKNHYKFLYRPPFIICETEVLKQAGLL